MRRYPGSIGLLTTDTGIRLRYALTLADGTKTNIDELVPFATSRTNFGGIRHWLTCLHCRRRVGVLYGGQYFRCRTCHGLHYSSQYEPCYERAVNEADKLRARVGGSRGAFDEDPFPPKPKRMRWATYNRLQARYDRLVGWYESEFMRRFGSGS